MAIKTKTKEQQERLKEIKRAKKDFRDTIKLNPVGFQKDRLALQSYTVDVKAKMKPGHNYDINTEKRQVESTFEGKTTETTFYVDQYQGNYTLGYICKLKLTA